MDNDKKLVQDILSGEASSYRVIVQKYHPRIFRLAWAFLGSREDAEDAVQEIFLRAFRHLRNFNTEKSFYPWLYSVARNYLRTEYRRIVTFKERKDVIESNLQPPSFDTPEEKLESKELKDAVKQSVHLLPVSLREPVILYYFDDLSVSEIAEMLELSEENIKSRLFRGRKKLRKTLNFYNRSTEKEV